MDGNPRQTRRNLQINLFKSVTTAGNDKIDYLDRIIYVL
jgi:hypothetical protein